MKQTLIGALMLAGLCGAAQAQVTPPEVAARQQQELKRGDPPRWFKDDQGSEAQLRTLRKEIGAALKEAQAECKQMSGDERSDCMQQAARTYKDDMANVRQLHADANNPQPFETSGR